MTKEKRLLQIPKLFKGLYLKAKTGRSQAAAIRSQCIECVGYVLEEVRVCSDTGCPLWEYRLRGRKIPAQPSATVFSSRIRQPFEFLLLFLPLEIDYYLRKSPWRNLQRDLNLHRSKHARTMTKKEILPIFLFLAF
jgi:hypothetical protein